MRNGILSLLLFLGLSSNAFTCSADGRDGIVKENDLWIGADEKISTDMTEELFNSIIDRVEKIYSPIIAEKGKKLRVVRKWEDGTVNAYANRSGNTWMVSMFGGLARHETISPDAFATVVCHEVGHHIGGAPKKGGFFGVTWASNEGQSDYFATSKCLRKFMETDDNIAIVEKMKEQGEIPQIVTDKCEANQSSPAEIAMCIRGSYAGLSLGNLFHALRKLETPLKFDTPDPNIVKKTNHNHPAPQCRLDTYFAGSVCELDAYTDLQTKDLQAGACTREKGHLDGLRPLCWFKPKKG